MARAIRCWAMLLGMLCVATQAPAAPPTARDVPAATDQVDYDRVIAQAKLVMIGNPERARALGKVAARLAGDWPAGAPRELAIARADWIESEGAYRANDVAAAEPLTRSAMATTERLAPGSKLHADLLLSRARLRREAGAPQDALADLQSAYRIFDFLHDIRSKAKALQSIGSIYQDAQNYERVLYYYRLAEEIAPNDPKLALSAYNNIANAYLKLHRYREAKLAYSRAFQLAEQINGQLLMAQITTNAADLEIDNVRPDLAKVMIERGLKLTSLASAASWRPWVLGAAAKLALAKGDLVEAQRNLTEAFALADRIASDQTFSSVQLTAYRVYKAAGDPARALEHLEAFRRVDDESRALAASTNAALMAAKFDFNNQNARIATLKTGQLQRDVALTRLRARQSSVIFSGILILLLALVVFMVVYLRAVRRNRSALLAANAKLALTNSELASALSAKSQFLATTSHEIRTPLNGILGMTQVILADRATKAAVRDRVGLIDTAGRAMRTLVDDILDFAKIDAGEVRLERVAVDLQTVIPDIISLWRAQAHDKGIALRSTVTGVAEPIMTDPSRLRQIMFNLLSNAIKFTAAGEVHVSVRALDADIGGGRRVALAVGDTGIGIPDEAFGAIFEPFQQLDTTTTRRFGGTGLGLAISRHLARIMGGDIDVVSTAHGSTFTVTLPYATAVPGITAAAAAAAPATDIAVLVASDNPIRRSYLRTALANELSAIAACATGEVAAVLASNHVSVVLADAESAAAALAASWSRSDVSDWPPVVVIVAEDQSTALEPWRAFAQVQIVAKPVRVDALLAILRDRMTEPGKRTVAAAAAVALPVKLT